jgi:F-type H+-transporting ATPase subunit gamma
MLSTRDVRRKIRSVQNIEQICRAMRTVASVKLRRAQARIRGARPYADTMAQILSSLGALQMPHPLLERRPVHVTGILAISADRGLCGSYNANVIRAVATAVGEATHAELIPVGRKVSDFCRRAQYTVRDRLSPTGDQPSFAAVARVADEAAGFYAAREWDEVLLIYTTFAVGQSGRVVVERLLPIEPPRDPGRQFIFEPSAEILLDELLPRYVRTRAWTAVLDATASEHAARVQAMSLASDNARDLIGSLTLEYNKARQAAITGELLDIVGTAEALA